MCPPSPPIKVLFLSGGMSQRMGSDKALLRYAGDTEIERWQAVFSSQGLPFYWSQRPGQYPESFYPDIDRMLDLWPNEGPLAALLSAFLKHPDSAWLVLACDWPLLGWDDIRQLLHARDAGASATVFAEADRLEPLCALYEPKFFLAALAAFESGERSLYRLLSAAVTHKIPKRSAEIFLNANDPDARNQALKILS